MATTRVFYLYFLLEDDHTPTFVPGGEQLPCVVKLNRGDNIRCGTKQWPYFYKYTEINSDHQWTCRSEMQGGENYQQPRWVFFLTAFFPLQKFVTLYIQTHSCEHIVACWSRNIWLNKTVVKGLCARFYPEAQKL